MSYYYCLVHQRVEPEAGCANAERLGDVGRRFLEGSQPALEAQLANLADEIAYNNHDVDDGLRSGLITLEQLEDVPLFAAQRREAEARWPGLSGRKLINETVRRMIHLMVIDLLEQTRANIAAAGVATLDEYLAKYPAAAERIERLSVTDHTFKRTRDLPENLFGASMGVFWGEPVRVCVEFEPEIVQYVRTRVWPDSQQIEDRPDGRLRVTLQVSNDWALRSWLLGFGAAVRVLEPPALMKTIADELARAHARYF